MSLYKAELKVKKIMTECENTGVGFNEMFSRLRAVECYGVKFPVMMLMNMAEEFIKNYKNRQEKTEVGDMQEKWDAAELKWNNSGHR